MSDWWNIAWPILAWGAAGLLMLWAVLMVVLWRHRSDATSVRELLRLLPDVLRLLHRLARDTALPRGTRIRLWLLLAYLASPIDLVPDFVPVLGYADDAILVALTLRSVLRVASSEALERHWPGTIDGLTALRHFAHLPDAGSDRP